MTLLKGTPALGDLDAASFDAVFVVGGQGPMVTMVDDDALHRPLRQDLRGRARRGRPSAMARRSC